MSNKIVLNLGVHPDEIAQTLQLPPSIADDVYLLEHYGTVEWSVKGVHEMYMGWFSGFIGELLPLTPNDEAERWLNVVDPEVLLQDAADSIARGIKGIIFLTLKINSVECNSVLVELLQLKFSQNN